MSLRVSTYIYVLPLAFIIGCSPRNTDKISQITNGGVFEFNDVFRNKKSFYKKLPPGLTVVYWEDLILKFQYGPSYANQSVTSISSDFVTTVRFFDVSLQHDDQGLEDKVDDQGLVTDLSDKLFESEEKTLRLSEIVSSDELIARIEESGVSATLKFAQLLEFFSDADLLSESSIREILSIFLSRGLISNSDSDTIETRLREYGVSLDASIGSLLTLSNLLELEIRLKLSDLVSLLAEYGLIHKLDSELLRDYLKIAGIEVDMQLSHLDEHFNEVGPNYREVSGKPEMIIVKRTQQEKVTLNSTMEYEIEYVNKGSLPASSVFIIDSLPIGVKYVKLLSKSKEYSTKIYGTSKNQVIVWRVRSDLDSGDNGVIRFQVRVTG